ncbi:flavin reductase family protein [Methylobacter tundripaludum]|uniref:Flavin reductase domain FMN-binding protein n=1 Tax=Methylobacter tundripaludum (strain ATCC BAA-1195 / DSM 17260 / SV96) TaxID=697282 RepID=G3IYG9_METTV|nr:flavin reductase family protein [Methylobacter tundripaludum]EGW21191.1 flavin reductase domain FMN-binding protein [Methylobacter tundripaludum SV96]
MTVGVDDFKKAMQLWASGVTVVTTCSEKFGLQGMTVTAFSSVSINPPQVLVCINESADTGMGIQESQCFAVNVLSSTQQDVSNQFAGGSSQEQRFENTPWTKGITGAPILDNSIMSLECKVIEKIHASTHWIIIGEVQDSVCRSGKPLLYYQGAYQQLMIQP